MKNNFLLTALCLLVSVSLSAQKVDLDRYYFSYRYRHTPSVPLASDFTTYRVQVQMAGTTRNSVSEQQVISGIALEGWKRVEGPAHVIITVNIGNLIIQKAEIKERVEISKDKDGKETGRTYFYRPEIIYTFDMQASAVDKDGKALRSVVVMTQGTPKSWLGSEYSKYNEAAQYMNNNRDVIRDQLTRENALNGVRSCNGTYNEFYAYPIYTENDHVWLLDSKKHPEGEAAKQAVQNIKASLPMLDGQSMRETVAERLKPTIEYLEGIPNKYTSTEKADKKLRYSAYYTLSKLYLALDNLEAATKNAEALANNDYDTGDAKKLLEDIAKVKASLDRVKAPTRQFVIDTEKFEGPK